MIVIDRPRKRRRELDLVPMIDVVFFLLCFFLIAGTIEKEDAVTIEPPDSRTSSPYMNKNFVLIVTKDGTLTFEDQPVSLAVLAVRLQPHLSKNKEMPLLVKADANLPADALTGIIKGLEQMGIINLSLATEIK